MPILFSCQCGKRFRAQDDLGGRQMKCSACEQILTIPPAAADTQAAADPAPTAAPETTPTTVMVRFPCPCGKPLQASQEFAGERTRCPACGRRLIIPEQDTNQPTVTYQPSDRRAGARRPSQPAAWDEAQEEGERSETQPVRRSRPGVWLWAVLAGLVLVATGAGAATWYFWFRPQQTNTVADNRKKDHGEPPPALTELDLVPTDGLGFLSVNYAGWLETEAGKRCLQQLASLDLIKFTEKSIGTPMSNLKRFWAVFPEREVFYFVYSTKEPYDRAKVLEALAPQAQPKVVQGETLLASPISQMSVHFRTDRLFVVVQTSMAKGYLDRTPVPKTPGPLSDALALVDKYQTVGGINVAAVVSEFNRVRAMMPPEVLKQMQPYLPLLETKSAVFTGDAGDDMTMDLVLNFADETKAGKAKDSARKALVLARQQLAEVKKLIPPSYAEAAGPVLTQVESWVRTIQLDQQKNTLRLHLRTEQGRLNEQMAKLVPALEKVRTAAFRTQSTNNLRQLAMAMSFYHSAHIEAFRGRFPPAATVSKEGKPLLSWRVELLPYLGTEGKNLYNQFKRDEPWDSEHNKKLLPLMPRVYAPVGEVKTKNPYSTFYQVFTGPETPFPGKRRVGMMDFTDGISNTFLIVEAKEAVPWTKPADLPYNPKKPLPQLGGLFADGFHAALADGYSVQFVPRTWSQETIRALITPAGGELMGREWNGRPVPPEAARYTSQNNLRLLASGLQGYQFQHRRFPPAAFRDKAGKLLLSWRVYILPNIGQQNLYKRFKLDEPWDSPHNKQLLRYMPREFYPVVDVKTKADYSTFYQVFTGPQTVFPDNRPFEWKDITDGPRDTFLVVEAKEAVPWTKPEDLPYDPKKPLPQLGGLFADGFHAALADGMVRFFPNNLSEETLRAAITPAGGELMGPEWNEEKVPVWSQQFTSQNNLRALAAGMLSYDLRHGKLPPAASRDKAGKPLLSWRVHILPHIGQQNLYKQFKLDEPWDSAHNKKLLRYMPREFYPMVQVKTRERFSTFYQVFTGPQTPFPDKGSLSLKDIKDGTSNTFLIIEAKKAVPWTKPEDLSYDADKPVPAVGGFFPEGFHAALANGWVYWFPNTLSESTRRAGITPAGGEAMGRDWPVPVPRNPPPGNRGAR
jgi:Protein of unknown function (DUF1559)